MHTVLRIQTELAKLRSLYKRPPPSHSRFLFPTLCKTKIMSRISLSRFDKFMLCTAYLALSVHLTNSLLLYVNPSYLYIVILLLTDQGIIIVGPWIGN